MKKHQYQIKVEWTGNEGIGASDRQFGSSKKK